MRSAEEFVQEAHEARLLATAIISTNEEHWPEFKSLAFRDKVRSEIPDGMFSSWRFLFGSEGWEFVGQCQPLTLGEHPAMRYRP